jgi:hypothetical protein
MFHFVLFICASGTFLMVTVHHSFCTINLNDSACRANLFRLDRSRLQNVSRTIRALRNHPHQGARDADGYFGYVADATAVRQSILQRQHDHEGTSLLVPSFTFLDMHGRESNLASPESEYEYVCNTEPGGGNEGPGWDLLQKVSINESTSNSGRILCGLYSHAGAREKITGVAETWGWRCDGFFAASTETVMNQSSSLGFGSVDIPHLGREEYRNMWQKTRSILSYMYDNYLEDYDYFYLCGDDTYLIVENLRHYLAALETEYPATTPLFAGQNMFRHKKWFRNAGRYNGGGAGYVLNRVALRRLVEDGFPTCDKRLRSSKEDVYVSRYLAALGIDRLNTTDDIGQQRFHGHDPAFLAQFNGTPDHWMAEVYWEWAKENSWMVGEDLISEQSLTFHYLKGPSHMKRVHAILYRGTCPSGTILGDWQRTR